MHTRFILIETSHAGNVGAAARAIKTMGFEDLVLVAPRWPNVLRREETIQRASGANDVLAKARIVATLDEALDGVSHLCATAMTPRDFGPPTRSPREHFAMLLEKERLELAEQAENCFLTLNPAPLAGCDAAGGGRPASAGVAFLFGSERFGMKNEDVYRCHVCLRIPTAADFGSLNLAAAVQLIAYEWRQALGGFEAPLPVSSSPTPAARAASAQAVAGVLAHWQQALVHIGFLDPQAPKKLMPRLNQLFNRAQLTEEEVHILRGVAKAMLQTRPGQRGGAEPPVA